LPEFADEKTSLLRKLNRDQTVVVRILPGWAAVSEELVDVAEIFGQVENGLSSNLFKLVREKNALSYAVGMSYAMGFHPGYFAFYAMTAPDSGKKVLKLLNSEISRIAAGGVSDEELDAAKASAAFEAEKIFDTPETWLRTAAMDAFYGIDPLQLPQRSLRIRNISNSRCNELLKKCFAVAGGVEVIVEGAGDNN
jgi:predicted Zn-dependent peptidase